MAQKVCLIDGSGYIFRAFYGLPPLTSPDGTPVNAVYGFTNMFLKLTAKIPCEYCLVLFDAKRQNFRNDIFPEYKGTRKEIPEDLIPQFPLIRKAVEALNLNYLEMEGYEADDLIATYTSQALDQGLEVVVVSGDKDLMQLIRPGVEFYDPMKDKFFTPEDVKEKFGVYPDKVVDVQALSGDSIDNVPGVPGIGPKTAAQLIEEYGSLEEVLSHAPEIKQNKRREALLENAENARISLRLVTLKKDVPVEHKIKEYLCQEPNHKDLENFVTTYGFNSLKPRLEKWFVERCSNIQTLELENTVFKLPLPHVISSEKDLLQVVTDIKARRAFALNLLKEPSTGEPLGLALCSNKEDAYYLPLAKESNHNLDLFATNNQKKLSCKEVEKYILPLLTSNFILKIGHNLKNTLHGITQLIQKPIDFKAYDDVAVISYDLDSSEHGHGVEELAELLLDYHAKKIEELLGSGKNKTLFQNLDEQTQAAFATEQAALIFALHSLLKKRLPAEGKTAVYENFDRPLIKTLYAMEERGIRVNANSLQELSQYFDTEILALEKEIYTLAGEEFNIGSPKQIGTILFEKLGFKGKKTPTGAWQTGADILEELSENGSDLAAKILKWREFSKLKSTYSDALFAMLDNNNRIHTTFSQIVANTGRLASSNPNLQNIPVRSEEGKKIRACFIAKPGYKIISSDYSQVELRLLASVAGVVNLQKAFAAGIDIHAATASHVFGVPPEEVDANLRRHAKAINFGIVYGISAYGLAKQINVTPEEAKQYIDAYFKQMPEIKSYMEETIRFAHQQGYVLTPFGRKCSIMGINDKNKRLVANAERAAINAPIQGGAADIIKLAMNQVEKELKEKGYKTRMLLQVHDELVFEAPEEEVATVSLLIKEIMEKVVDLAVPFKAEVGQGDNWAQAH